MEVRLTDIQYSRAGDFTLEVPALSFREGRATALIGPNGSGKSTLLRLVSGLAKPDTGSVCFGAPPPGDGSKFANNVAFAFQASVFLRGTLRSNLDMALRLHRLGADERARRITAASDACGIGALLDRDAHQLSGGESRRANLARALALRAPVTLLDEPLAGLDGPARRQLLHELPALLTAFASTTILVTHDRDEALHLADDVVVLLAGRVRAQGPKADIFLRPPNAESAEFLGFTVLGAGSDTVAIHPGALRPGPGDIEFPFAFERIADLGTHRELVGRVAGVLVTVTVDGPLEGPWPVVSAAAGSIVHVPRIQPSLGDLKL